MGTNNMIEILQIEIDNQGHKTPLTKLIPCITQNNFSNDLWELLITNEDESLWNFTLTLAFFYNRITPLTAFTETEDLVYKGLDNNIVKWSMIKTLQLTFQNIFNEMITKELDVLGNNDLWVGVGLDTLYKTPLPHINLSHWKKKNDQDLYKKKISISIIITTIYRVSGIVLYTRLKNIPYPKELVESINFTKGYLVCFEPTLVHNLKQYKYTRKNIRRRPTKIKINRPLTFLEGLDNNNYSSPLWLNENDLIRIKNLNKDQIFNSHLLTEPSNIEKILASTNFLNSVELCFNELTWPYIKKLIENNTNLHHSLTGKNELYNKIYLITKERSDNEIVANDEPINLKPFINSVGALELIETQKKYFKSFFLDHRLDTRLRVYCYQWPINYQLSHLVRVSLVLKKKSNPSEIWSAFKEHPLCRQYVKNFDNIFLHKTLSLPTEFDKILKTMSWYNTTTANENSLKIEALLITIIKFSEKSTKNKTEALKNGCDLFFKFLEADLTKDWKNWLELLKFNRKKLPYLLSFQIALKEISEDKFDTLFWGDASSNAIQLITLRLGKWNNHLLMLTNLINNTTPHENIYEYLIEKIKDYDHSHILKTNNIPITNDEFRGLLTKDLMKFLIMPSSYGMGMISYRWYVDTIILENDKNNIWDKLSWADRNFLADHLWDLGNTFLKEIGFDMGEYKTICSDFYKEKNYSTFIWKNDIDVIISPTTIVKTKRPLLLKKINETKLKIKETTKDGSLKKLNEVLEKLKTNLKNDDKLFWKRHMTKTPKNSIFTRIYHTTTKIDSAATKLSLIPNTIHAYDASIIHRTIEICKEIGIEILTIHDSIGCDPQFAPLIKTIFKLVNIELLDKAEERINFPLQAINKIPNKEEFFEKILKSENFFR